MPSQMHSVPPFDLVSYARRGPATRDRLTPAQIAHIARTVRRTPEVMVKVLSRGGQDLRAVGRHLDYLRLREDGEREIETDDGQHLTGEDVTKDLLDDWDLDLEQYRRRSDLDARGGGSAKLVHKLMFSMPAGTPPENVLTAVKNFAREEFGLKHRYAMVLHTDEPHPHVHMVVKAISEHGARLHIRKATLHGWRTEFARHLRALGVPANATQRYVRGETHPQTIDGIYRASLRGESTHMCERAEAVSRELAVAGLKVEPSKAKLMLTRKQVHTAWLAVSDILISTRKPELALQVRQFANQMPEPLTEKEHMAAALLRHVRESRVLERSALR
jgi:hypothetical protein